jgi:hypothetical protein
MTIQEILDNILHAVFGRDVRQSMHDGVKRANDVADETKTRQDDLEVKYDQLLDNFSSASPSDAEIVDARAGIDGTIYTSLKRRIDSEAEDRYTKEEVYSKEEAYNKEEVYTREEVIEITGQLINLGTDDKSSLVASINEVFQYANSGKEKMATAIGNGATSSMTWDQLVSKLNNLTSTIIRRKQESSSIVSLSGNFNSGFNFTSSYVAGYSNLQAVHCKIEGKEESGGNAVYTETWVKDFDQLTTRIQFSGSNVRITKTGLWFNPQKVTFGLFGYN